MAVAAEPGVAAAIEDAVARLEQGEPIAVPVEVARILRRLRRSDPAGLHAWLDEHAEEFLGLLLQRRFLSARGRARHRRAAGAFQSWREQYEAGRDEDAIEVYFCGDIWKPLPKMLRPDWLFIAEDRSMRARASLLDMALARRYAERLPDDTTETGDIVSPAEAVALREQAEREAEEALAAATD